MSQQWRRRTPLVVLPTQDPTFRALAILVSFTMVALMLGNFASYNAAKGTVTRREAVAWMQLNVALSLLTLWGAGILAGIVFFHNRPEPGSNVPRYLTRRY